MKPSRVHFTCVWKQKATLEMVVQSYVLLPRLRVVTVSCVWLRTYLFMYLFRYLLLLCIDAETFQHPIHPTCDVCFREGNFTRHIPKQFAFQLWIPASRSLTESCPKRSSWGTRSEWQCSHVQTGQHDLGSAAVWELPCSLYLLGKYLSR